MRDNHRTANYKEPNSIQGTELETEAKATSDRPPPPTVTPWWRAPWSYDHHDQRGQPQRPALVCELSRMTMRIVGGAGGEPRGACAARGATRKIAEDQGATELTIRS